MDNHFSANSILAKIAALGMAGMLIGFGIDKILGGGPFWTLIGMAAGVKIGQLIAIRSRR